VPPQRLSVQLGKQIRVVGWYHSHPHITVHPSHVGTHLLKRFLMEIEMVWWKLLENETQTVWFLV
jgi:proteasome lid subunit RPN8/RPN11